MNSNLDLAEAYRAVERTYSQGQFAEALVAAETLLPRFTDAQGDDHLPRLQLLIGHIHLYGLNQPEQALPLYRAVAETAGEPAYRELARQGISHCEELLAKPSATERAPIPASAPAPVAAAAMPWLPQLSDPELALQQSASVARHPQELPVAVVPASPIATGAGASPWQAPPAADAKPAAAEPEPAPQPQVEAATELAQLLEVTEPETEPEPEPESLPAASPPALSPDEEADLAGGLRKVVLR